MAHEVTLLAILGSLRRESLNRKLLDAAVELAPAGVVVERAAGLHDIPLYDDDVRAEQGLPEPVARLGAQIAAADAVLFVSPEYNYSLPGVLKNAIDWVSRAPDQPFAGKPVGIMGASPGRLGTARMQYHLRQVLVFLDAHPLNKPEVIVTFAAQKFDDDGRLADEATALVVREHLDALARWTRQLRG